MAETYKNFKGVLNITEGTFYTCPPDTIAIVQMMQIANVTGVDPADASVFWTDASDSDAETHLCFGSEVVKGDAVNVNAASLVLEAGDTIGGFGSDDGALELSGSVLEITNA